MYRRLLSRITFHASRITFHQSRITHHSSRFTHHVSPITFHLSQSRPASLRPSRTFRERAVEPFPNSLDLVLHPARGRSLDEFCRRVSREPAGCVECSSPIAPCESARPGHKACRLIRRTISRSRAAGRCCAPPWSGRDTGSPKILFYAATPFQILEAGNIPGSRFVSVSTRISKARMVDDGTEALVT